MSRRCRQGIGLAEVLLVVLVIGLLAAAAIPRLVYSSQAKTSECSANVALLNAALDDSFGDQPNRPVTDFNEFVLQVAADNDRFPNGFPKCPFGMAYEYDPATRHIMPHAH